MGFHAWLWGLLKDGTYRSQYEMADAFGTKQPTVNHWLHRRKRPNVESLGRVHEATGESLASLYDMIRQDARETSVTG